jgi:hypothetical protein
MEKDLEVLVSEIDQIREKMVGVVQKVNPTIEICPGWTIKEAIGHITAWEIVIHKAIQAFLSDDPPYFLPEQDFDVFNEEAVEYRSSWTLEQVLGEWKSIRADLKKTILTINEEDLSVEMVLPWGSERTLAELVEIIGEHEGEHMENVVKVAGL